ncbi:helicase-related protein [Terrarubrum flagellatum]|uniref:helicase-related protein n=1 Tax=Terrirubrum flagellatum TaxID=2895980 RepID=UPI003144DEBD
MPQRPELTARERARNVTAVLGPTNTGKTHLAIERMLGHETGMIGLPLRLLAREVYGRVVERAGADAVALITGEEKIKPANARYWVATVEAMPRDVETSFLAVDEIQLAANFDRGHVFTDRLLNMRGRGETLLIGASTMKPLIETLLPGVNIVSRPRLSKLTFAGEKKLTRLPPRSAIVAFSVENVYEIAELIRRQRGGAAVVLGALSPRTRNAQVELFQSGDVDYLVATDAIGMGLNLDVDHVAFSSDRKFDGFGFRRLTPAEFGQIAGRAGRHMRDGTFGSTGRCDPFEPELVEALEDHRFDPIRMLQWRNPRLDFSSLAALLESLAVVPREGGLTRAPAADDVLALEAAARDEDSRNYATNAANVEILWDVCQVPDYRKVSPSAHAELVTTLYRALMRDGRVSDDWFERQLKLVDRTDGDIDTLSARIAQVRSWTFVANRPDWLADPQHWQGVTRAIEDRLSDALHERLAQRFVDRRTSVLMRRLRENAMLEAEINGSGDVSVEGQHVGQLHGFQFVADAQADAEQARALRAAAAKALAGEIEKRAEKLAAAPDEQFVLASDGAIRWNGEAVARLGAGERVLAPVVRLLADEQLTGAARDNVQNRIDLFIAAHIKKHLGPLQTLEDGEGLTGIGRGIAFQIGEALGVLDRARVAQDVKSLDQEARGALRKLGVRFGAYHLYLPLLVKPAPRALAAQLWSLKHGGPETRGVDEVPRLASSGRTSIAVDKEIPRDLYRAAGFRVCGERAVRVDILERLADLIRPAIAYRPGETIGTPPAGTADGEGFVVTGAMTSLTGCSGEDFASILRGLGYLADKRPGPAITRPIILPAPTAPIRAPEAEVSIEAPAAEVAEQAPSADAVAADVSEITTTAEPEAAPDAASIEVAPSVEAEISATQETPAATDEQPAVEAAPAAEVSTETAVAEAAAPEEAPTASVEAAEPATEAAPPAEPELIEVWRMGRVHRDHHHRPPREGRDNRRFQGRRPHGAPGQQPAEGEAGRPGGDQRRPFPRQDRRPQERREAAEGGREQGAPEQQRDRGPRPPHGRPGGEQRRFDGKPPRRDDRRDERRDRPRFEQPQRPPRDKQPDPDSPFAKLAALKARLEGKDGA